VVVLGGGRPYSLIKLIEGLLIESRDNCMEEDKLVEILKGEPYRKREDSVRRSIEIGVVRLKRLAWKIIGNRRLVCLANQEVLKHKERLLSILEDVCLNLTYPTGSSPTKKYEPVPEVDKPRLLTSLAEHLLADKTVLSAVRDLIALSRFASSYCDRFMKLCIDKARKLCPRHAESFADRLRSAVRIMVKNRDHVDQIVEDLSREIRGNFGLPHGMEGKIAEALRELYEYFGDALLLCDEISIVYDAESRNAVDKILNVVKNLAVEGRLVGRCSICGTAGYDKEEVEQLKSILERYLKPPPPPSLIIKNY
jgi:hypothetical protein